MDDEEVVGKCPSCSSDVIRFAAHVFCKNERFRDCSLSSVVSSSPHFSEWLESAEAESNNTFLGVCKARREYEIALSEEE